MEIKLPHSDKLQDAVEYLYFWRWRPNANDVVIFWREGSGSCRRFCIGQGGGEFPIIEPPEIIHDDEIDCLFFDGAMRFALEHGILDAPMYSGGRTTADIVDTYAIKTRDGRENFFKVPGGLMRDPRADEIRKVFVSKEGLLPFYDALDRLREEMNENGSDELDDM